MQQSNAPSKLLLPFAADGTKNEIPVDSQVGVVAGAASLTDGFPPLTRTPLAAGGVPPSGLDMNGILYAISAITRWINAGGGFAYDGDFANSAHVDGYPKGARVMRADGLGYWLNTVDGNKTDPDTATAAQAAAAGWVPDVTYGLAAVTMTNANVTLTPSQYGKPVISITGALTANLNLVFPALVGEWLVANNTTGNFTITCKTPTGSGVTVRQGSASNVWCDGANIRLGAAGAGGATGGGSDEVFHLNGKTATVSYSIPEGKNAGVFGPLTIADGVTVTVPDGSTLTIV